MKNKLGNPTRVAELNPKETLKRIGLESDDIFCDVGAGTGIFTFAAAEITKGNVYAVEISEEMLAVLKTRAQELNAENVVVVNGIKNMVHSSCEVILLCTVLHEFSDVSEMMDDIRRILVKNGVLSVIEFHKHQTPMGPPVERRLDSLQLEEIMRNYGFNIINQFTLGENFYCSVFTWKG